MSDIVERLRYTAQIRSQHRSDTDPIKLECIEAADEITRLRAENGRLRALVEEAYREGFDEGKDGGWIVGPSVPWKSSEARAALKAVRRGRRKHD